MWPRVSTPARVAICLGIALSAGLLSLIPRFRLIESDLWPPLIMLVTPE
jgi:hypothetical protein